jgi:shikimate kinase
VEDLLAGWHRLGHAQALPPGARFGNEILVQALKKLRAPARPIRYTKAVNDARLMHNLALIGFMGVGKSSVGRLAATQLHFEFLDTDGLIETRAGKSIARIFAEDGEAAFRACEREVVRQLEHRRGLVVAAGGGLAANPDNLVSLKRHAFVVCLWASPEALWERVRHQTHRPLLQAPDPQARIRQLLAERDPFYRQADLLVNTEMRPVKDIAQLVVQHFRLAPREPT